MKVLPILYFQDGRPVKIGKDLMSMSQRTSCRFVRIKIKMKLCFMPPKKPGHVNGAAIEFLLKLDTDFDI